MTLTARAARPEDKAAVAALSAHIWEGDDYVPDVFDDWVADPRGEFTLFFEGDELVAFGKLTELAAGEWWLEGLRVHPAHQGRGIARQAHEHAVALADRTASGVLRFATGDRNVPVHHLAQRTGFELIALFCVARTETRPGPGWQHFRTASAAELPAVRTSLDQSPQFAAAGGLVEEWWSWQALLPQLPALVAEGRLLWWESGRDRHAGLVAFSEDTNVDEEERIWINYADTEAGQLPQLWRDLREWAERRGARKMRTRPGQADAMQAALAQAGWDVEPDHTMRVYARPLPGPARLTKTN